MYTPVRSQARGHLSCDVIESSCAIFPYLIGSTDHKIGSLSRNTCVAISQREDILNQFPSLAFLRFPIRVIYPVHCLFELERCTLRLPKQLL